MAVNMYAGHSCMDVTQTKQKLAIQPQENERSHNLEIEPF